MIYSEKIQAQFGTWAPKFKSLIESEDFDNLFKFLKQRAQVTTICPLSSEIFKSFESCNYDRLKCVILLQDPYNSFKGQTMVADGIPMSCSKTEKWGLQPSLNQWYKAIEESYFNTLQPNLDLRADLTYLLKEEHILLLNSSLSVEKDRAGSHSQQWKFFIDYFIEEIINKYQRGLPVVLVGKESQRFLPKFSPMLHHIKCVEHMAASSYRGADSSWKYDNMFKWIDNIIRQNNGEEFVPRWYRLTTDEQSDCPF